MHTPLQKCTQGGFFSSLWFTPASPIRAYGPEGPRMHGKPLSAASSWHIFGFSNVVSITTHMGLRYAERGSDLWSASVQSHSAWSYNIPNSPPGGAKVKNTAPLTFWQLVLEVSLPLPLSLCSTEDDRRAGWYQERKWTLKTMTPWDVVPIDNLEGLKWSVEFPLDIECDYKYKWPFKL